MNFEPGDIAYLFRPLSNRKNYVQFTRVTVVRKVLFSQPAYRVRAMVSPFESWVADGLYLHPNPPGNEKLVSIDPEKLEVA